jgi:hypothetical protein
MLYCGVGDRHLFVGADANGAVVAAECPNKMSAIQENVGVDEVETHLELEYEAYEDDGATNCHSQGDPQGRREQVLR